MVDGTVGDSISAPVSIGIAGWSYPDWRGVVYPKGCRDELRLVAELVDVLEVNSTFYRVPAPGTADAWVRRVHGLPTLFTAKLPQAVTHDGHRDPRLAAAFRAALEPLADVGRLRALLAQFSYRFEAGLDAAEHLRWIVREFGTFAPVVLEVRHRSWRAAGAQRAAVDAGVRIAHLDYPGAASGFAGPTVDHAAKGLAYYRLHGRNRAAWFDREAGRDQVYDWLYDERARDEIERRIESVAAAPDSDAVIVVANNHYLGKATKLALELIAWYRDEKVRVPEPLLAAYPSLREIARAVQGGLFD